MSAKKSKTIKIAIGVILALLLIGIGVGAYKITSNSITLSTKEVQVPNIVGKSVDDARKQLEGLNLVLVEGGTESSDEPEGTIIKMNPEVGTMVKEKSSIRVIVSEGKTKPKMPDLVDYDLDYANNVLNSYGLKISSSTQEFDDNAPKGQIIKQTPKKDTEITSDTKITVVISKGPEIKRKTVPNVISLDMEVAKSRLIDANLTPVVVEKETENESDNGKVISQSIEGNKVEEGTSITIEVGKYVAKQEQPQTINPGNAKTNESTDENTTTPTPGTTPETTQGTTKTPNTEKKPSKGTTPSTSTGPWNTTTSN